MKNRLKSNLSNNKIIRVVAIETGNIQSSVISGGDKLLEEMSNYLSSQISLTIIIPEIAAWHWKKKKAKIITIKKTLFDKKLNPLLIFLNYILRIYETIKVLNNLSKIDVIYSSTNIFPDTAPAFFLKLRNPKIRWFGRIHHLSAPLNHRPGNLLINLSAHILQQISLFALKRKADVIAVLNLNIYNQLIRQGFKKNRLAVIPAGIDIKKWQVESNNTKDKIFDAIFIGRFHPSKGIFDLIPIWCKVCKKTPKAKLAIVGQRVPSIVKRLEKIVAKEKISSNVDIIGPVPQNKIKNHLATSKIFIFPDHEAGFGLAVLEAMAMGLPVIGWDIGILGNVYKKGYIAIKPFNTIKFADAVINLIADQNTYLKLSYAAKQESYKHSWPNISKKFEVLLFRI